MTAGTSAASAGGAASPAGSPGPLTDAEVERLRSDFPILGREVGSQPLAYLDSGATAQRPRRVIRAMAEFVERSNAGVHRGAHTLASEATEAFEGARARVARFVGAPAPEAIVFTSGTTAAVNLLTIALRNLAGGETAGPVPSSAPGLVIRPGDRIVVTEAEHHANLVPWQRLAAQLGAELAWVPVLPNGRLDLAQLDELVTERTRVLAFTHVSNVTGAVTDVQAFVRAAHQVGAIAVMDAAQSAPHLPLCLGDQPASGDVSAAAGVPLGVDFAAFGAHKMFGPGGIGALYGRPELLAALPPAFTGGGMVQAVTMRGTTYLPAPARFEAGTQPVAEAVGWAAALDYLDEDVGGMARIAEYEERLTARLLEAVAGVPGVRLLGPADQTDRLGVASLAIDGVHPHDAGQVLDAAGIAVRVGHHCAMPVHRKLGVRASTRASLAFYNTLAEIDRFGQALAQVRPYFGLTGAAGAEGE
ncbi:MAG: SufS family cysteine desulfurase [Bifidobacteriaceae bacterium]|jgi:cysteine desulfurase/selenocysteine lyase|nr:SufS family cysteine desulfurase [Bifidobacteriaceae bacterium]